MLFHLPFNFFFNSPLLLCPSGLLSTLACVMSSSTSSAHLADAMVESFLVVFDNRLWGNVKDQALLELALKFVVL